MCILVPHITSYSKLMNINSYRRGLLFISTISLLLLIVNKEFLRPNYGNIAVVSIILDSMANFLAPLIYGIFPIDIILKSNYKNGRLYYYTLSILLFIFLIIEEYFTFFTTSNTFDLYDIFASGLGGLITILIYEYGVKTYYIERRK